jgi:chromosomal replication initiation ATPase DnaA
MASRTPPSRWPVQLPDLSSRLRSITAVPIHALEDELLQAVLIRMLAERQLDLSPQVRAWLLLHLPRSTQALRTAIALLDAESIRSAKLITRTWAERILTENGLVPPKPTDRIRGDQAAERQ